MEIKVKSEEGVCELCGRVRNPNGTDCGCYIDEKEYRQGFYEGPLYKWLTSIQVDWLQSQAERFGVRLEIKKENISFLKYMLDCQVYGDKKNVDRFMQKIG